jgi:hypothetical protein
MLERAFNRVKEGCRTAEWAVGLRGNASPSTLPLSQRSLNCARARALLELSGQKLPISPWFVYVMGGGATVAAIIAAHIKKTEGGGGCMAGLRGGNNITGRTGEQHVDTSKASGGCMAGLRGGNTIREGPQSSTQRRPGAVPHCMRTPSTSSMQTGKTYHGHGSLAGR